MAGTNADILYMKRCIDLAKKGIRDTFTNPKVGCVIVHQNRILGEGYHQKFGESHAEVIALNSVAQQDRHLLPYSTMYVSLEPCAHVGKTPACSHTIVREGIKNVVIGCTDPNPIVSGRGIKYLKDHDVNVTTHILEAECQRLLVKFKKNLSGIPYITLKWAQSSDNFISKHGAQTWLSNEYTRVLTHKWRSESEGIMVGKNTVLIDDPSLDVRDYWGPSPIRIIMDTQLNIGRNFKVLSDGHPTIIFNTVKDDQEKELSYIKVSDMRDSKEIMHKLFKLGISSVMIEGGATLIKSFISSNCWHEARVITTKAILKDGIAAPMLDGRLENNFNLSGDNILIISNPNI